MHPTPANPQRGVIVSRLAEALRDLGHEIFWAPLGHEGGALRYLRARQEVAASVRTHKPDVVHVHFGYSGLAVPRVGVPVVTSFYGDDLNGTLGARGGTTFRSKIGILISQIVALRSTARITVSETLRERLWFRRVRRETAVVRDAVDPRLFRPLPQAEARARLGIRDDPVLIMFPHDTAQPTKRLWLAEAAVKTLTGVPRARLWIVNGQTPDDMPWYYAAADVMIITSLVESGPSSAKEALACGLPVVSVPVGDLELFNDVPDGMLKAGATPAELGSAVRRGLEMAREPRRSRLPDHLALPSAARTIEEVYRAVCGR